LQPGYLFERHLDAEVAARHHQRVGEIHDLTEPIDGLRLLDLGHDGGAPARDLLCLGDIFRPLDERERDPVDAGVEPGFEIGAVLLRQRRERHGRVGQAHAFAVGQFAADLNAREDMMAVGLDGDEPHLAVVEQEGVAGRDGGEDFGVRQVHPLGIARRGIGVEREGFALGEHGRIVREASDPELGALEIEQNPDRPAVLGFQRPDRRHQLTHARMRGVTHIDAEDVGAGLEQAGDDASV
jgi:hypothetical protein